jgi:short-subunit dehydrogenase
MESKNIIITGASSGIGADLCELLHKDNKIFAVARSTEKIKNSKNIYKFSCDVSKPENIDLLFTEAQKQLGEIDIFFANAGFAYCEKIEKADWKHIESIFSTNVFSVFYSISKFKELKIDQAFNFVVTASAMSYLSIPGYSLYGSTKFALKGFADAFRYELNNNQKLSLVYPVATYTSFFDIANAEKMPWPRQKSLVVAKAIIKGVKRNKKHIYPSCLFRIGMILNGIIPIFKIYLGIEGRKFRKENANDSK